MKTSAKAHSYSALCVFTDAFCDPKNNEKGKNHMTIKTLTYIHEMLLDNYNRRMTDEQKAKDQRNAMEEKYGVDWITKGKNERHPVANDNTDKWEKTGKAAYLTLCAKVDILHKQTLNAQDALDRFELQDFR